MIVFVHQPEYIPWLGFFDKILRCDLYVIYDDAQFEHGGFHNRNRVRTPEDWSWLTVPISHDHPQKIRDVKIAGTQWKEKQLNIIRNLYGKAPYFTDYYPTLKAVLNMHHQHLTSLNLELINAIANSLGAKAKIACSSQLINNGKDKNGKLVEICKCTGADTYLCGSGGRNYVDAARFQSEGIKVLWHSYVHPTYRQMFCGFQPNMSIIDLLFNVGPQAKEVLLSGGKIEEEEYLIQAPYSGERK